MDNRPRWFVLGSGLLAVFTLSVFGTYYHRWIVGVAAAFGITVVLNLVYRYSHLAALFMYGPNGEELFRGVEGILRASALCKAARVQVRPGPLGAPHREILL